MIQINTSIKQKQIHRHREDTQGSQGGGEVWEEGWESEISRGKLAYIGWINNAQHRELYSVYCDKP